MNEAPATFETPLVVFIVDDDMSVRDSLSLLLGLRGFNTRVFDSADSFLAAAALGGETWSGCLLTDMRMPGCSGLDLLGRLAASRIVLPTIVMSAFGDVASVREVFRHDAIDFLAKPFAETDLIAAVEQAFASERRRLYRLHARTRQGSVVDALTGREREVCALMVDGLSNHEIAARLGISHRTAQVHRGRIMQKMQVSTLAELIVMSRAESALE